MGALIDQRLSPADLSAEQLKHLLKVVEGGALPTLIGADGERIELPKPINDLFVSVIAAMNRKEAVFVMHEHETFTTQAAANFLGVSRQYLVRLLEEGRIPFHKAGTHRRIFFRDLVKFQQERSRGRRVALDQMTEELVAAGLYDRHIPMERSED